MKVILDTNVVISAVYFGGAPLRILKAWRDGQLELVVTDDRPPASDEELNPVPFIVATASEARAPIPLSLAG